MSLCISVILLFNHQDLIINFPYGLPYNSHEVSLENVVLD